MSTPFLPPPPTNETLVVAEFTSHLEGERREKRRRLPGAIAWIVLILTALAIILAASVWVALQAGTAIEAYATKVRAARTR